jgi:hypothetical protein
MTKSFMQWHDEMRGPKGTHFIEFNVLLAGDEIEEQLGFVYLLSAKFDGELKTFETTFQNDSGTFGSVRIVFDDSKNWDDAKAHCSGHLDQDGCVMKNYVGALKRADPNGRETRNLVQKVKGS